MSCNIIPPIKPNPFLHYNIINELQSALASAGYLSLIYPLASLMEININNRRGNVPVIYGQQIERPNDYIQMFPDGAENGISFFEIQSGDYDLQRGTPDGDLIDIVIRIVITANLKNIKTETYDYTDELISRTILAIQSSTLNQDINSIKIITDKPRVFEKYTYLFNELQSLAYPITGFAIELGMTVDYNFECVIPDTFDQLQRITEEDIQRITEEGLIRIIES